MSNSTRFKIAPSISEAIVHKYSAKALFQKIFPKFTRLVGGSLHEIPHQYFGIILRNSHLQMFFKTPVLETLLKRESNTCVFL